MAVSFVAESHAPGYTGSSYQSSVTINKPTGTQEDDLLLAFVAGTRSGGVPAGWNQLYTGSHGDTGGTCYFYYKIATDAEPSSYTFSFSSSRWSKGTLIAAYRGVDISDPIGSTVGDDGISGTSFSAGASISVTNASQWLVHFSSGYKFNTTTTRTWTSNGSSTERADFGGSNSDPGTASMAWYDSNAPMTVGSYTRTHTASASMDAGVSVILTINGPTSIPGTFAATASAATADFDATRQIPTGSISANAPAATANIDATRVIPSGSFAVTAPAASSNVDGSMVDVLAAVVPVQAAGAGEVTVGGGVLAATAPAAEVNIGVETRIFGDNVLVVPSETRRTTVTDMRTVKVASEVRYSAIPEDESEVPSD